MHLKLCEMPKYGTFGYFSGYRSTPSLAFLNLNNFAIVQANFRKLNSGNVLQDDGRGGKRGGGKSTGFEGRGWAAQYKWGEERKKKKGERRDAKLFT